MVDFRQIGLTSSDVGILLRSGVNFMTGFFRVRTDFLNNKGGRVGPLSLSQGLGRKSLECQCLRKRQGNSILRRWWVLLEEILDSR